jgi:hypothetical protein
VTVDTSKRVNYHICKYGWYPVVEIGLGGVLPMESQFLTFTAAQSEQISEVNGDQQRNLRRRGLLSGAASGWNAYSIEDVARLVVVGFLSRRGMPPKVSSEIATKVAPMLVANALNCKGAIEGGDEDARNKLRQNFAPDGVKRFAVATGPFSAQVGFGNDIKKIFFASLELDIAIIAIDLKLCALKILEGAKPLPLVKLIAKEEAA